MIDFTVRLVMTEQFPHPIPPFPPTNLPAPLVTKALHPCPSTSIRTFIVREAAPRAGRRLREVGNKLVCPDLLGRLHQGAP